MRQFQPGGRMERGSGATFKDLKKSASVGRLFKLIWKLYKGRIAAVLLCIVISSVTSVASALFTRNLIDDYILPMLDSPAISGLFGDVGVGPDYGPLAFAILRLSAVLLAGIIAGYLSSMLMIKVGQGTMLRLRRDMFQHMEKLPLRYFDSHSHGDVMSTFTNDVDTLRQVIGSTVPNLFSAMITLCATFVSMIALSIPLTIVTMGIAAVMFYATRKLGSLSEVYFKQRQENLGAVNGFIEEMVSGQKVVKVYCHEKQAMEQFAELNEKLRKSVFNANKITSIVMPVNHNLGNFGYVLLAVIGALIAIKGLDGAFFRGLDGTMLTLGTLVSFLTLQRNFTRPISQISNEINSLVMASAGSDRVYAMLDEIAQEDKGDVTLESNGKGSWKWKDGEKKVPLEGLVSLQDVDFGYVPEKQVLYDITLTAYPGQKIAFVGGTGAGKTTITNLINRFYEIQDGTILYDGFPVSGISLDSLRRSLGTVLQETHLFSGTVMENIRYGRLDATDEECKAAARLVCADQFIRRLPLGYETMLNADGSNLSQGERQLLAIARAAVADPPVLILDEATSSIDTRTEKLIQKGMDSLMKGRTSFVIAHRLSTVRNADYIMVMDKGRIIERGKHEELLALKGKYYELYTGNEIS